MQMTSPTGAAVCRLISISRMLRWKVGHCVVGIVIVGKSCGECRWTTTTIRRVPKKRNCGKGKKIKTKKKSFQPLQIVGFLYIKRRPKKSPSSVLVTKGSVIELADIRRSLSLSTVYIFFQRENGGGRTVVVGQSYKWREEQIHSLCDSLVNLSIQLWLWVFFLFPPKPFFFCFLSVSSYGRRPFARSASFQFNLLNGSCQVLIYRTAIKRALYWWRLLLLLVTISVYLSLFLSMLIDPCRAHSFVWLCSQWPSGCPL